MSLRSLPLSVASTTLATLLAAACAGSDSGSDLLSTGQSGGATAAAGNTAKGGTVGLGGSTAAGSAGAGLGVGTGGKAGGGAGGTTGGAGGATGGASQSTGGASPSGGTGGTSAAGTAGAAGVAGVTGGGSAGATGGGSAGATGGGAAGATSGGSAGTGVGGSTGGIGGGTSAGAGGDSAGGAAQGGAAQGGAGGALSGGTGGVGGGGATGTGQTGQPCGVNGDCDSALCITNQSADLGTSPARGYCSLDCTDYLKALIADPNTTFADPCAGMLCLNFGTDAAPLGRCTAPCEFGAPALAFQVDPTKCGGRDDVACMPLHDAAGAILRASFGAGDVPLGYCRPQCSDDSGCAVGWRCDVGSGGCVPKGTTCQAHETKCDPTLVDGAGDPLKQCEGLCVSIYGSSATPAKQKIGLCMDPCEAGNVGACDGGNGASAYCGLYNLWGYDGAGTVDLGTGDLALCGWFSTNATSDQDCGWEAGSFVRSFATTSGPLPICVIETECLTNTDCIVTCETASDCTAGDTCVSKQCRLAGGAPDTAGRTCVDVPALGEKRCLDHTPGTLTVKGSPGCVP